MALECINGHVTSPNTEAEYAILSHPPHNSPHCAVTRLPNATTNILRKYSIADCLLSLSTDVHITASTLDYGTGTT